MGLKFQNVSYEIAEDLDFHKPDGTVGKGALVSEVGSKSPAAQAGLQVGDIITRVGDQDVTGQTMPRIIASILPGTKTELTVWHKGSTKTVPITLAQSPNAGYATV